MELTPVIKEKLESILNQNKFVLFMKGSPQFPQCGFSSQVVDILKSHDLEFTHVDVLEDPEIRSGIKIYGNWPTIPQLYISQKLIGGCDIICEMHQSGELDKALKS